MQEMHPPPLLHLFDPAFPSPSNPLLCFSVKQDGPTLTTELQIGGRGNLDGIALLYLPPTCVLLVHDVKLVSFSKGGLVWRTTSVVVESFSRNSCDEEHIEDGC